MDGLILSIPVLRIGTRHHHTVRSRIGADGITQLRGYVMNPTPSNSPEEPIPWEAMASFRFAVVWQKLANGGRKIVTLAFWLKIRELPNIAAEQAILLVDLRAAAVCCAWPPSKSSARWGGRTIIAWAYGLGPHLPWIEPAGSKLLRNLAAEATMAGDLGFMRNFIDDIQILMTWSRTNIENMSTANQRRIAAVNWAVHEIRNGRWFSKAELAEHLDRAGLGTDAANLARDIFKMPGFCATPKQLRRR